MRTWKPLLSLAGLVALIALGTVTAQEAGHHPNRVYIGQDGALYLNGAAFYEDANNDISGSLEVLDTVTAAELQLLDGVSAGSITASRVVTVDGSSNVGNLNDVQLGDDGELQLGAATGGDVNILWSDADASNHAAVIAIGDTSQQIHIADKGAKATDWTRSAGTHPELAIHSNTTPITDYLAIGNHDGTTATLDVVGGTTFNVDIAGTTATAIAAGKLAVPVDDGFLSLGASDDLQILWSDGDATNHSSVIALDNTGQQLHITDVGAKATDWNRSASTHPEVSIHSNTTPATDYLAIGNHDGTNASIDMVGGTGLDVLIDGVGALRIDDAAVASFAGATDTVGQDVYVETQDAGGTATAARVGGLLNFKTGDGSAGAAAVIAGAGGASTYTTGAGGAASGTAAGGAGGANTVSAGAGGVHSGGGASGAGGAGGAIAVTAGAGGNTSNVGSDNAGVGGAVTVTASAGGNASAGTGDGGAGGAVSLTTGAGGTSSGGAAGADGKFTLEIGAIGAVQIHDTAIAGFAAATDTVGQDVYLETQDAGGTATAARVGGLLNIKAGDGSAGAAAVIAGAGGAATYATGAGGGASGTAAGGASGALTLSSAAGGAHTGGGATGAGGAGGAVALTGGAGGATSNVGSDNGGAGAAIAVTAGAGGLASAGTGDGGAGGAVTLTTGAGGTSAGGAAGADGMFTLEIGAVGALQVDDSAISGFAASADTVGQDIFIETQSAGGTATAARTGARFDLKTGDGSAGAAAVIAGASGILDVGSGNGGAASGTAAGGASGAVSLFSGPGGAHTGGGASGAGGAGGAVALTGGAGGATSNVGSDNGGAGAGVTITAGVGGLASAGTGDGGAGGDITLTPGSGGTSAGANAGAPGDVVVSTGVVRFAVQTIAMGDAAVVLTLVPGTPSGTLLTGNVLYVDAESSGTEDLKLPPEGDCTGLFLIIENTGGESIIVEDDAAGAVVTLETANQAYVVCDGTSWTGTVGVP